ncbi:hypothetical protein ACWEPC_15980 [Nonomuraea sp. NPDC004297]
MIPKARLSAFCATLAIAVAAVVVPSSAAQAVEPCTLDIQAPVKSGAQILATATVTCTEVASRIDLLVDLTKDVKTIVNHQLGHSGPAKSFSLTAIADCKSGNYQTFSRAQVFLAGGVDAKGGRNPENNLTVPISC